MTSSVQKSSEPKPVTVMDRARRVRVAIFDVDGVLTDGTLYLSDADREMKAFNIRDGLGMKLLQQTGVRLALLTGRRSECVERRSRELGIDYTVQGAGNKGVAYDRLLEEMNVTPEETSYMGDDLIDLPVLRRCGLAATVADAPDIVKANAHITTRLAGGRGAVREFCEYVMRTQGTFAGAIEQYLES